MRLELPSLLITDDDRDFRETLRNVFEPRFRTLLAGDGEEALDIVRREEVHLLLLDMHMPKLTGLETLRQVKRFKSLLPCILLSARLDDALKAALDRHSPPPGTLVVELTETALADDMAQARHFAASLEGLGVPLALDDFGVGWASLQYLKTLPGLQCLKIDAEFVRDLVSEERSQALVRAIVELARSFGQQTIAEPHGAFLGQHRGRRLRGLRLRDAGRLARYHRSSHQRQS